MRTQHSAFAVLDTPRRKIQYYELFILREEGRKKDKRERKAS